MDPQPFVEPSAQHGLVLSTSSSVPFPDELRSWSWGAFGLGMTWGIGHKVYSSWLMLIPIVNVIMLFVLAIKGNEWAWNKGSYSSAEEFRRLESTWTRAGIFALLFFAGYLLLLLVLFITGVTKGLQS